MVDNKKLGSQLKVQGRSMDEYKFRNEPFVLNDATLFGLGVMFVTGTLFGAFVMLLLTH